MSSPGPLAEAGRWTAGTPNCYRLLRGPTPNSSLEDPLVILSQGVTRIFPSTSDPYPEKVPLPQQPLHEPGLWVSAPTSILCPCHKCFPQGSQSLDKSRTRNSVWWRQMLRASCLINKSFC